MILPVLKTETIIYILLQQLFTCRSDVSIICEDSRKTIACPDGNVLTITSAIYGRTISGSPCFIKGHSKVPAGTSCNASVDVDKLGCNFQESCELEPVNNKGPYPPDPCRDIRKYLNVTYNCITKGNTVDMITHVSSKPTTESCLCPCSDVSRNQWDYLLELGLHRSEMREIMKPYLKSLEKNLSIDTRNTNRRKRMKISAFDDRKSATSIGYVGVAIIVTVVAILVLFDLMTIFNSCKRSVKTSVV